MRARFQRGVWQLHSFRLLMSASMISIFGSLITSTAFPYIAVTVTDAGPVQMALLSLAGIIPGAILGSVVGIWIDRLSRPAVMIAADLVSAAAIVSIPVVYWLFRLSLVHLLAVAFLTSVARLSFRVADRSFLPQVVGSRHVEQANATLSGGSAIAEAGGFSVGGLLVQLLSGPVALLFDAVSFVISALIIRRIPAQEAHLPDPEEIEVRHWRNELSQGLGYLRRSPMLSPLAISLLLMSIGIQTIGTAWYLFAFEEVGFSPGVLGVLTATGGIGSLIGSVLTPKATLAFGAGPALIGSLLMLGLGQGSIILASSVGLFAVAVMLAQQLTDGFWVYYESTGTTLRQLHAPGEMLGRINGAFESIEFIGLLVGAGVGALIGETIGLRATIATGACMVALAGVSLLISPIRNVREVRHAT